MSNGVKKGGAKGMHRMPDGRMMKDSDHKEFRPMPNTRPVPKDATFGDRGAKRKSPDMELMPYRRPAEEGYTFKRGGGVRGAGIAKRGLGRGRMC